MSSDYGHNFTDSTMFFLCNGTFDEKSLLRIAHDFRAEHCGRGLFECKCRYGLAREHYDTDNRLAGQLNYEGALGMVYLGLSGAQKQDCLQGLKRLQSIAAEYIDEMVMGDRTNYVTLTENDGEKLLGGEGAIVYLCKQFKENLNSAKMDVELACRIDMALQKFGKSYWSKETPEFVPNGYYLRNIAQLNKYISK